MADNAKKGAAAKPKRTMLTPAERVAKLEADLAEARAKAEAKANKQGAEIAARITKLNEQVAERRAKIAQLEAELDELGYVAPDAGGPELVVVADEAEAEAV